MITIILSIGAINAFIPLIIILILIVAAAGLMRGYNIFALFGISALLGGAGKATLAGKNVAAKTGAPITRGKAQNLKNYVQKKGMTFAKYYKQEYKASRALGVSRVEAAKIASANARIRMMKDSINTFQSSLNNRITIYNKKTNKKAAVSLIGLLSMLKASSALKNDTNAQNLYNSINSELTKLNNLAAQANQIPLNRTSAAAAKANLNNMRQIQKDYRETAADNLMKDLNRYERIYHINRTKESAPYYVSKFVNLVIPNKLNVPPPPSFLNRNYEPQAHVGLHSFSSGLEKSFKKSFKP